MFDFEELAQWDDGLKALEPDPQTDDTDRTVEDGSSE